MDQVTWLALGGFATLLSGGILLTDIDEVWFSLPAMLAWILFGLGATNVEIYGDSALVVRESYVSLALLAGVMAVVMLLVLLKGAAVALNPDEYDDLDPAERP